MFQCPNCRAFTDLSAEVDDSNDLEEKREKQTEGQPSNDSGEQAESEAISVSETNGTGEPQDQLEELAEENLVNDVQNLHLQDDQQTDDTRSTASPAPNSSTDDLARSANTNIPGWQPTQPLSVPPRQSHLRSETPTSDDNPLTPRNDSGPLAFDGRAGMS
jgi:hypothetical protein